MSRKQRRRTGNYTHVFNVIYIIFVYHTMARTIFPLLLLLLLQRNAKNNNNIIGTVEFYDNVIAMILYYDFAVEKKKK